MKRFHYYLRRSCATLVGIVFFVAGVLKLMDPVGAGLVMEEYFHFFGTGFLTFAAKPLAAALALLEALLGAAMITGAYRRLVAWIAFVLTLVFTAITLVFWIVNPAMDCGCFGEAIHLTHFQTFAKNVLLLVLEAVAFFPLGSLGRHRAHRAVSFWIVAVSLAGLLVYTWRYIPPVDFTPFDLSSRLYESVRDEVTEEPEFVSTFVYEKNGQEGVFTLNSLPDSTWTFVRAETMQKEDNLPIDNYPILTLTDAEGNLQDSLAVGPFVMAVSVYRPDRLSEGQWTDIGRFVAAAGEAGFTPLLLVAASPQTLKIPEGIPTEARQAMLFSTYFSDYKTLVSLNRSNGGASYFHNGSLIEKWARRALPSENKLGRIVRNNATEVELSASTKGRQTFWGFFLYSFALLFFV